ncbi:mercury(II) reductase, partial [Candidatus Pacearchaeota archaeon CG10_big_fil_rev_8_21_14_0_10_32_42]
DVKGKADFVEALKETREMVEGFREKNYKRVIGKQKYIDFKEGRARFVDANTVAIGNKTYKGGNILIATGASTFVPQIEGINEIDYLTNVNIFNLKEKPKSIVIFGGGAIAMEFSQIFNHFGIDVTVLQRSDKVLSKYDSFIGEELRKHLEAEGIKIYTGATVKKVRKTNKGLEFEV